MVDGKRVAVAVVCFLPSLFRHMRLLANFFLQSCPSEWDSPCLTDVAAVIPCFKGVVWEFEART